MDGKMWGIAKSILLDKRLISVGSLLLVLVLIDRQLPCGLHPVVSELDTLEHFMFGFLLSDFANNIANSTGFHEMLGAKFGQGKSRKRDLLIRLIGFLLIGGLLWESSELFIFPLFGGPSPDSFFSFPITLKNIDGTIDVTAGIIGCFLAWYSAR
jgi:hypothetical protein